MPLRVIKPLELSVQLRPFHFEGRPQLALGVLIAHPLDATQPAYNEQDLWQLAATHLKQWDVFDEGMPKAFAEYLVYGSYYGEQAVSASEVQVSVGALSKTLVVTGQREWRKLTGSTEPKPLLELAISYDYAYGGEAILENPVGIGADGVWLPQIEHPDARFSHPKTKITSAGFAAINIEWLPRKTQWGTYNSRWEKNDAPGFARDIQWQIFQLAPQDQWSKETQWHGGEQIRIRNMNPKKSLLQGTLPKLRIRIFILKAEQLFELPSKFESAWLFPSEQAQVAAYRAQVAMDTFDGKEIGAVLVAYEHADSAKKPVAHYAVVLEKRLQPEGDIDDPEDLALRADARVLSELNPAVVSVKTEPILPGAGGALGLGALAVLAKMKGGKGVAKAEVSGAAEANVDDAEGTQLSIAVAADDAGASAAGAGAAGAESEQASAAAEPAAEEDSSSAAIDDLMALLEADIAKVDAMTKKALDSMGITKELMAGLSKEGGMDALLAVALPKGSPTVAELQDPDALAELLKEPQRLAKESGLAFSKEPNLDEALDEAKLKLIAELTKKADLENAMDPKLMAAMNKNFKK